MVSDCVGNPQVNSTSGYNMRGGKTPPLGGKPFVGSYPTVAGQPLTGNYKSYGQMPQASLGQPSVPQPLGGTPYPRMNTI